MEGISVKTKDIVCVIIYTGQRLLIAGQNSGVHENIWGFPGGKAESKETWEQAVVREIREELGLCVDIDRYLTVTHDNREDYALFVHAYLRRYVRDEIHLHAHHKYALVTSHGLYNHQFEATD